MERNDFQLMAVVGMRPRLVRFFERRSINHADAEDLAQDVLLKVLRTEDLGLSGRGGRERPSGYLFRVAANVLIDRLRRLRVERAALEGQWGDGLDELSGERVLAAQQELDALAAVMDEWSERARVVFLLRRVERVPNAEIAQQLGISVSAVDKHVRRAAARLQRGVLR